MDKEEIKSIIDQVTAATNYPAVLFTSNPKFAELLEEYFPGIKVNLLPESYMPDTNTCYILPRKAFDPLQIVGLTHDKY